MSSEQAIPEWSTPPGAPSRRITDVEVFDILKQLASINSQINGVLEDGTRFAFAADKAGILNRKTDQRHAVEGILSFSINVHFPAGNTGFIVKGDYSPEGLFEAHYSFLENGTLQRMKAIPTRREAPPTDPRFFLVAQALRAIGKENFRDLNEEDTPFSIGERE